MRAERSNIKAGIASIAAVTALALAIAAWNALERSRRVEYRVGFSAEQGVYGIGVGSDVMVGGLPRGQVVGVRPTIDGGAVAGYEVRIAIDPEVPLYEGMKFRTTAAGINGDAQVEIYDTGRPKVKSLFDGGAGGQVRKPLDRDRVHVAVKRDPMRDWFGTKSSEPVNQLMASWWPEEGTGDPLFARLEAIGDQLGERGGKLKTSIEDTWARVSQDFERWKPEYERIAAAAESAFDELGMKQDAASGTAGESFRGLKAEWERMPSLPEGKMDAIGREFDRASGALKSMMAQLDAVRGPASDVTRVLGEVGAQGSLALQEFDAAYDDALREPWRVFERPDGAYLEIERRQETARAFAEAATAHRWALKSIDEALRRDEALMRAEPALAQLLKARLEAANAEFDAHRARMEALLLGDEGAAGATAMPGAAAMPAQTLAPGGTKAVPAGNR